MTFQNKLSVFKETGLGLGGDHIKDTSCVMWVMLRGHIPQSPNVRLNMTHDKRKTLPYLLI